MLDAMALPIRAPSAHRSQIFAKRTYRSKTLFPCRSTTPQATDREYHFLSSLLSGWLAPYWERTPSADAALAVIEAWQPDSQIAFDHLAFRTFGLPGHGISSMATWLMDMGYLERGKLDFEKKKLRAKWYSPPSPDLPRIFVSELKVEELSPQAQQIIAKYAASPLQIAKYFPVSGLIGLPPWPEPTVEDYRFLAEESEYAAWVLVNGFSLNHTTVAVHKLAGLEGGLEAVNAHLKERGFTLNEQGGEIKKSPDGLLLQSSTVADEVEVAFAGGEALLVPGSYVEFAERLVLPEFAHLKPEDVEERHRRDGFEAANADRIFESTTIAAQRLGESSPL